MLLYDYHIHTKYSFDGDASATPRAICEAAIAKGLTSIAITDHFEANSQAEGLYAPYDAKAAYSDIMQAKEDFKDKIHVSYGIEIGQASQYPDIANDFLRKYPVEFVLASLHNLKGKPDFYFMDFKSMPEDEIISLCAEYFTEMKDMICALDRVDSLAHITYPCRYISQAGKTVDMSAFYDKISDIFRIMVANNIALEVNTSTYTKGLGFCMPDREIVYLYKECGGELVTVGSDAHSPSLIGSSSEYAEHILRECGIKNILVYSNGKKEQRKIN